MWDVKIVSGWQKEDFRGMSFTLTMWDVKIHKNNLVAFVCFVLP